MKPSRMGGAHEHGRVRNPVGRSFKSIRGKYPSRKMGRMIQWESQLEKDAILLLEYSPGIVAYQEQPRKITYVIDDEIKTYFPDFEVSHADQQHGYIEVKPSAIAQRRDQMERFSHIATKFGGEGSYFKVLTEASIRKEPLHGNLRLVERYRGSAVRPSQWSEQKRLFNHLPTIAVAEAESLLNGVEHVWALIADGIFIVDLSTELTAQSSLLINHTGEKNVTDVYF